MRRLGGIPPGKRRAPRLLRASEGAALLLVLATARPASADYGLTLLIFEDPSGAPTEARVSVLGPGGSPCRPYPDSICLFQDALGGYFYADSSATVAVPAGVVRVRAAKGLEYGRFDSTFDMRSDVSLEIRLVRWAEPRAFGWVGADDHAHLAHPPVVYHLDAAEALRILKGEGIRTATFLEHGYLFTGAVDPLSDAEALFFSGEEYRSPIFGHLGLLGIDSYLDPDWGYLGWPLNASVIEETRTHEHALACYAHPTTTNDFYDVGGWPGTGLAREIWVDAALGDLDALDVLSYSNLAAADFTADTLWHHLWNCGFTVPGTAGTDAAPGWARSLPVAGLRSYARVPDPYAPPAELYDSWIEAVRRGRTFVTIGPMITEFDAGGCGAGETLTAPGGMPLDVAVHARVEWNKGLRTIDVLRNGEVVETHRPTGAESYELTTVVPVRETSWITVRHDGWVADDFAPTGRVYAEATPVLVRMEGDELTSSSSGALALARIDMLDSLLAAVADFPSEEESIAAAAAIATARGVWEGRADSPPAAFSLLSPCAGCSTGSSPILVWQEAEDPDPEAIVNYRVVIAADAAFSEIVVDTAGIPGSEWTPTVPFAPGAYWWRVRASDERRARRWGRQIERWFDVVVPTSVAGGTVEPSFSLSIAPSPARADVFFRTAVPPETPVRIEIYSASGRLVRSLLFPAGRADLLWDGRNESGVLVSSGIYPYRAEMGGRARTGTLVIVR